MRVIGTAGHVDHGKTTLVTALTGINPDRLQEEQLREMTIDLGFAWLTLPDGEEVGIVDMPGHRDFIANMLAGVGGIDAALFVVAADEGVMPQTREHLAILDILQVQAGLVVLTKIDLVDDPEWLELVEDEVHKVVTGTVLEAAPVLRVSARSGEGLLNLTEELAAILKQRPRRPDLGRPRLPVDRIFSMPGFGTVVTGTLLDGQFSVGDELEILPGHIKGRIRGLQTHRHKVDKALPGSRTAVNLSGVDVTQVQRGCVLVTPGGKYEESQRIDVQFRLLPDAGSGMRHDDEVKLFIGSAEVGARVRLLGIEELMPGQESWMQLELIDPIVTVRGDRYILRRPSPSETLGGGMILDAHPVRRHKRFSEAVLRRFEALNRGTPAEVLYQASLAGGILTFKDLAERAHLELEQAEAALKELVENGQMRVLVGRLPASSLGETLIANCVLWENETQKLREEVGQYHRAHPLRRGLPREELKNRLGFNTRVFNIALQVWVNEGKLVEKGTLVALADFMVRINPAQQAKVDQVLGTFNREPYSPPSVKDCQALLGDELYQALVEGGQLVQVSEEVVFSKQTYDELLTAVRQHFEVERTLTVAQFRDRFNTSRRYVLAFLEHLDAIGETVREGEGRRKK